jgi:O-antigen/teichoic acid export membrane protein
VPERSEVRATLANMLLKAFSLPLEKVCRLVLVIVAAPLLGQAGFGRFQFAATVTTLLALGTDLGLGLWTTRALARRRLPAGTVVRTGLAVRALAALPYAAATAVVAATTEAGQGRAALLLLGVAALASGFVDHFGAVFRGQERFADETRLNVLRALLVAGGGLAGIALGHSLSALAGGMAAGSVAVALAGLPAVKARTPAGGAVDRLLARQALGEALPIWLAGLLSLLYFRGDAVLLQILRGDAELGIYSAAYKIFEGSMLVPAILLAAAFPPLARAHSDRPRQRRWEGLVLAALLALGLLGGAVCRLAAAPIVALVFGPAFAPAVASLRVLALGLPLLFVNYGLTHFLIARDLGGKNLVLAAAMLALNVALNLLLIPRLGGPGAAWATVATEAALTGCCLLILRAPPARAHQQPPAPAAASRDRMTG